MACGMLFMVSTMDVGGAVESIAAIIFSGECWYNDFLVVFVVDFFVKPILSETILIVPAKADTDVAIRYDMFKT